MRQYKYFDEIVYFILISLSLIVSINFDLYELFHQYTRTYEDIEVDEWFIALLPISIITIWYALRKIHKNTLLAQQLIESSYTDPITSLPNRMAFRHSYDDMNTSDENYLFLINVINFKDINHSFGIIIGDKVIKEIALKLQSIVFQTTYQKLYRVYGDEFAFFHNETTVEEAYALAKEIKSKFEKYTIFIDANLDIQIDIAISFSNTRPIFQTALIAMQNLKNNTHKSILYYDEQMDYQKRSQKNIKMLKLLKEAKEKQLFIPYYQPIVDTKTQKIVKYETLIRIQKEGELISPGDFLTLSKKYKYYRYITRSVIEKSFTTFKNRSESFTINFSQADILNDTTIHYLLSIIKNNPETASRLTIEIVESEDITFTQKILDFRKELKKHGVSFAIDDFGSGYSNIVNILKLQPEYIKLDGSIIQSLAEDPKNYSFVENIISFAKKNNIRTIAEFVSSKKIYELVLKLDIDLSQGYYFHKPLKEPI